LKKKLTAGLFVLAALACAQDTTVELDPAHTQVNFVLGTLLHTVHGDFRLKQGTIRFNPATGTAGGQVIIDAASGESGNASRDARMHKSTLESGRYPEIVFTPDRVTGALGGPGPCHVQVHGLFKMHGVEHEMVLPVEAQVGTDRFTASTQFTVPYQKWGMKNPSTLFLRVEDKVEIEIHTGGRVVTAK